MWPYGQTPNKVLRQLLVLWFLLRYSQLYLMVTHYLLESAAYLPYIVHITCSYCYLESTGVYVHNKNSTDTHSPMVSNERYVLSV